MSIVAKKIMMGSGAVALPSDDQFNRVSFLSHFDGANNGVNNAFDDSSTSNHTITANGNVTQGSFGPFARPDGEWGWNFDGDGDYLTVADSTEFDFGTGNFTIEGWINPAVMSSFQAIFSIGIPVQIYSYNNTVIAYFNDVDSGSSYTINGLTGPSSSVSANTWTHFAVVRNGNTYTTYVNGVAGSSLTSSDTVASSSNAPAIGTYLPAPTTYEFNGYISNLRLVKGTAVYTSNFTPSTSKLTAITNTKLLTCQSNRFIDNSASGHAITPTGTPAVTAFGPFLTSRVYSAAVNGASAYSDGSGDSLSAASSADFALGTGDFTVEFWVYQKEVKNYTIYFDYRSTNSQATLYLYQSSNGAFDLYIAGTSHAFTPPSMLDRWAHIAISRSSSTTKLFVDGVQYLSFSDSTNYVQGTTFYVGRFWQSDTYNFNGYMCDFRFVKGTAVYTSAFTPPTAPLTAITNTKLLLNMANGQAFDSAAQNNLTLFETAKISTAQKKFGTASLLLDGNSDYAAIPAKNLTGPFTMEFFAYLNAWPNSSNFDMFYGEASSVYMCFTSGINGSGTDRSIQLAYDPSGYSGITQFNVNSAMSSGAWHHVAITKNSSNVHVCYIDGTSVTATNATKTNTFSTTGTHFIGRGYSPSYHYFGGYIDDFRISQLVRYTSNFTAPSEPFPDKGQ